MRAASWLPYSVLLQVGFTVPLALPPARCALTAPFHPYPTTQISLLAKTVCEPAIKKAERSGGIFSVALAVGSHRPGVTWHPALWSPDFPP